MKYLVVCQRDNVTAACFGITRLIFEGPMFLAEMNTTGAIPIFVHGDVLKGKFHVDHETTTARRR
jgi:hypothetical protein